MKRRPEQRRNKVVKGRRRTRRPIVVESLGALQVDGLGLAALVLLKVIADLLVLVQRTHAGLLDGSDVDERVLAAVVRLDEAETLGFVEKFYGANWHICIPSMLADRLSVLRC